MPGIIIEFVDRVALPAWRAKIHAIIQRSRELLRQRHEALSRLIARLSSTSLAFSFQGYRLFARSYGGIASEVAVLSNLIVSLARSETSAIALDAQGVSALREEIGYGV